MDGRKLSVELLFRNRVLAVSSLVTTEIEVRIFEYRFIPVILTLGLDQLRLKRTRIDFREYVALPHHLTLAVIDAHQLSIDPAFNSHRGDRRNRSKCVDVD